MAAPEAWFTCALGADALRFRRMQTREKLGRVPEYRLDVVRSQQLDPVDPAGLLGTKATIKLLRSAGQFRYVNGWITAIELGGAVGRYDVYQIVLRPWLWYLSLGADCRIFQDKNALQVIEMVFGEYSGAKFDKTKLSGTPRTRPFCVQYRESDLDFVSRLMEEEGIWYYFTHVEGDHTLMLANGAGGHAALPEGTLHWSFAQTEQVREDIVTEWRQTQQVRSLKFTHDDFDHESPQTVLLKTDQRTDRYPKQGDLEVYDWPGRYAFPADGNNATQGDSNAKLAVRRFETLHKVATTASPCRSVAAGMTFSLVDHPRANGDYLITAADIDVDLGDEEASDADRGFGFRAKMQLVPKAAPFATDAVTPKPIVRGPQTAFVVGPEGDELHVDKLGRVKVHFRWDRVGKKNEQDTCWIRVATPWASKNYGMITTPRIGDEVVVGFLEGDPDRPLIIGSLYNGDNKPPYELPEQATVYGIRSRSTKEGATNNFNELRFDDKKGSEYVWFQAEKDFHRLVKNDATDEVVNNNQVEIGKNHTASIGEKYDLKIGDTVKIEVGADTSAKIKGDLNVAVDSALGLQVTSAVDVKGDAAIKIAAGAAFDVDAGAALKITAGASTVHIKAGTGVVIDGGVQLTIKAGPSSIVLDPSGVSITGPMVKMNSGGSPGSAGAAAKANPTAPAAPADIVHKDDPLA